MNRTGEDCWILMEEVHQQQKGIKNKENLYMHNAPIQTRMKNFPIPKNWEEYRVEIDEILRHYLPKYEEHKYITPGYYIGIIKENPKRFPIMAKKARSTQVRYINYFLVEQGRVPWNERISKRQTLMIPDEVVV